MSNRIAALKKKIVSGQPTYGSWITLGHPAVAEIMAQAGFDWLVVDLEHSAITIGQAQSLIQVIELAGVVPFVRLTNNDPHQIKRVMDAGARGIIIPMVNTPEEARAAVAATRYPPSGCRGVGLGRAQKYGFGFVDYAARLDRETIVVVQIEHIKAVDNAEAILSVPGVDAFLVGPYDLSGSLGVPGQFEHPKMRIAIQRIHAAARKTGRTAGFHVIPPSPEEVSRRRREGFAFLAVSLDTYYLGGACRSTLAALRGGGKRL
jgi:2-keto-3-deoxy-L-rhamnonate aldolase RhmA